MAQLEKLKCVCVAGNFVAVGSLVVCFLARVVVVVLSLVVVAAVELVVSASGIECDLQQTLYVGSTPLWMRPMHRVPHRSPQIMDHAANVGVYVS